MTVADGGDASNRRCILITKFSLALVFALVATGCTVNVGEDGASGSPTPSGTPTLATCEQSEVGYTVSYPASWYTNDGDVAPGCTYFDPEPIDLEAGTEPDVAIALDQEDIAYGVAADPDSFGRERSRDAAVVDDRQAVAVVHESDDDGLYPPGTLSYVWLVDLDDSTFVASTYDASGRDFERDMDVLDRMMETLDFSATAPDDQPGDDADRSVVARFQGGGVPLTVLAGVTADEVCLTARSGTAEELTCGWDRTPDEGMSVGALDAPGDADAIAGLAVPGITRVLVGLENAATVGARPTTIPGADLRAWAAPIGQERVERVVGYTADRRIAAALDARGRPIDVLADVNTEPEGSEASEDVALLTDLTTGVHAGYDRIAFEFRDVVPGFEASYEERPIRAAGSGREVDVEGEAVIVFRMEQASGRERTGEGDQTYTGPERLDGSGTFAVREIVRTGDFEAVLTWAIGVGERRPFRVDTIGDTLYVDVLHQEG